MAKHEFGHVLGLGILYASESNGLDGVKVGTYRGTGSLLCQRWNLYDFKKAFASYGIPDGTSRLLICIKDGRDRNHEGMRIFEEKGKVTSFAVDSRGNVIAVMDSAFV